MAAHGRIRRRLILAIALTGLIPWLVGVFYAQWIIRQTSDRFFLPEVGERLEQSLGLYQELARTLKEAMRNSATAIALDETLKRAVLEQDREAAKRALLAQMKQHSRLVSLELRQADNSLWVKVDRGKPLDSTTENALSVVRVVGRYEGPSEREVDEAGAPDLAPDSSPGPASLGLDQHPNSADAVPGTGLDGLDEPLDPPSEPNARAGVQLVALFAAEKARFDELEEMSQFVDIFDRVADRRGADTLGYIVAFAVGLMGIVVIAAGAGSWIARSATRRITGLASAARRAGAGDLDARVPVEGSDELADLALAFNRMLTEIETSRGRIEYLQRIEAWQEMARRLAHEIKNPLTPIQLAVQDIHRRYDGQNPSYQKLLDTALEIIEDEVATLRRLVTEFSDFARLPQSELAPTDLSAFLSEQRAQLAWVDEDASHELGDPVTDAAGVSSPLELRLPDAPARVMLDRQLFRRALINLVRNAIQASSGRSDTPPRVRMTLAREEDYWVLDIEDNGSGIAPELRVSVFDPYVTTKNEGTGLGLAIVKKIVVDHGGSVHAEQSELGGAKIRVHLPAIGTAAAQMAERAREWNPPSSRRSFDGFGVGGGGT